jgi:(E)-4-hydroxy-3-methylbut-2-enyl-diphosphate synthase
MMREMKKYIRLFERRKFTQLVLSAKSSDTPRTIEINRLIANTFDYPLHIGLTHAGLPENAQIPSAIAIGSLLAEGIGDTIRVSAAGDPVTEVRLAQQILITLGLRKRSTPELIVCPTCARAQIDVVKLARLVEKNIHIIQKPIRIAIMGCTVNGPGEAADADFAVCVAKDKAFFYRNGQRTAIISAKQIVPRLLKELGTL